MALSNVAPVPMKSLDNLRRSGSRPKKNAVVLAGHGVEPCRVGRVAEKGQRRRQQHRAGSVLCERFVERDPEAEEALLRPDDIRHGDRPGAHIEREERHSTRYDQATMPIPEPFGHIRVAGERVPSLAALPTSALHGKKVVTRRGFQAPVDHDDLGTGLLGEQPLSSANLSTPLPVDGIRPLPGTTDGPSLPGVLDVNRVATLPAHLQQGLGHRPVAADLVEQQQARPPLGSRCSMQGPHERVDNRMGLGSIDQRSVETRDLRRVGTCGRHSSRRNAGRIETGDWEDAQKLGPVVRDDQPGVRIALEMPRTEHEEVGLGERIGLQGALGQTAPGILVNRGNVGHPHQPGLHGAECPVGRRQPERARPTVSSAARSSLSRSYVRISAA